MPGKIRLERIGNRIRELLSEMLLKELNDPRLYGVFINDVKVDRELSYANIYYSALEGSERAKEIQQGLESASGYMRKALAEQTPLRTFPQLRFHWDPTPEKADRIEKLISSLKTENAPGKSEEENNEEYNDTSSSDQSQCNS